MTNRTPAYELGVLLGELNRAFGEAARHLSAGFAEATRQTTAGLAAVRSNPKVLEALSERRYRDRIAAERRQGLAYVRAQAARVRQELGLPR